MVELHRSLGKHVHSFPVISILEVITTSLKWTISNSRRILTLLLKLKKWLGSCWSFSPIFRISSREKYKNSMYSLLNNTKLPGLLSNFVLPVKKGPVTGPFLISLGRSFIVMHSGVRNSLVGSHDLVGKACELTNHYSFISMIVDVHVNIWK